MENKRFVSIVLIISIIFGVLGTGQCGNKRQAGDNGEPKGDLKYTFGENEELPAGFFDPSVTMEKRSPLHLRQERPSYPPCQDGSGGICVAAGQCVDEHKAQPIPNRVACSAGQECCHGPPLNSNTPCADRGGECVAPPRSCGNGPKVLGRTECSDARREVCCIWTV